MAKRVKQTSLCAQEQVEQLGDGRDNYLEDRISKLPNEILACIIFRLKFREAASTSVLSKRWQYLWTFSNGSFDLDGSKKKWEDPWLLEVEQSKYVNWVNRVLELHQGSTIDEFRICFRLDNSFKSSIDKWIDFAFAKRAQRFELNLKTYAGPSGATECYTFPHECYVYLQSPHGLSSIKSLRFLSLKFVNVTGEILEFFLLNCPLVEQLCVDCSDHLVNLKVAGSSLQLKYLEMSHCKNVNIVEICAPNLVSFKYFGQRFELRIQNAPLLIDVSIGEYRGLMIFELISCAYGALASYLSQLETLKLTMRQHRENILLPQCELSKLRHLTLSVCASESASLLGFTRLIKASPLLHRFTLQLSCHGHRRRRKIRSAPKCTHQNLKVVEIVGFVGRPIDLELAIYLLENAIMLEKIIINPNRPGSVGTRWESVETEVKQSARKRAKQLETKLPQGVELVIC